MEQTTAMAMAFVKSSIINSQTHYVHTVPALGIKYEPTVRCRFQLRYDTCEIEADSMPCGDGICYYVVGSRYSYECPGSK